MNKKELVLSKREKQKCLRAIIKKNNRILYTYEQTFIPDTGYDYKKYVKNIIRYVSSSNELFDGNLINILINLYSIAHNDLDKDELRRLVHENTNMAAYLLRKVGD